MLIERRYDFSGGLNTRESPYLIAENEVADCLNVVFRESGKARTRKGHEEFAALPDPSNLLVVSGCDNSEDGGVWVDYKDFQSEGQKEGEGCVRGGIPLAPLVHDCDSTQDWTGATGVSGTTKYQGTGSVYQTVDLLRNSLWEGTSGEGWTTSNITYEPGYAVYGPNIAEASKYVSLNLFSGGDWRVDIRVKFVGVEPSAWEVRFYSGPFNYFVSSFVSVSYQQNVWVHVQLPRADFAKWGSPTWLNITRVVLKKHTGGVSHVDHFHILNVGNTGTMSCQRNIDVSSFGDEQNIGGKLVFWTKLPSGLASQSMSVTLEKDASNYATGPAPLQLSTNWQEVSVNLSDLSVVGEMDWSSISRIRISFSFTLPNLWYSEIPRYVDWHLDYIYFTTKEAHGGCSMLFTAPKNYVYLGDGDTCSFWVKPPDVGYSRFEAYISFGSTAPQDDFYYATSPAFALEAGGGWQKLSPRRDEFEDVSEPVNWEELVVMFVGCRIQLPDYAAVGSEAVWSLDYIYWQMQSVSSRVSGIYEFRKRDGTSFLIACAGTAIYDLETGEEISGNSMSPGENYDFATMADKCFVANGADAVQCWDGTGEFDNAGIGVWPESEDTPPKCRYVEVFKNRLFCFGCTGSGLENYLVFSEVGDPTVAGQWPSTNWIYVGPDSGDLPMGLAVMQDTLVILKSNSFWLLMGDDPENFVLNQLEECQGCAAPRSIALSPHGIFYLSHDGIYLFDGRISTNISARISGTIQNELDNAPEKLAEACGIYYSGYYICWFISPGSDYPDMALVYDTRSPGNPTWTKWRGIDIGSLAVMRNRLYAGYYTRPTVVECLKGYTDDGRPIETKLRSKRHNLGIPEVHKFFHHLYVYAESVGADYGMDVICDTQNPVERRTLSLNLYDMENDLVVRRNTIAQRGRYLELTFGHNGANEPISVLGYTVGYKKKAVR